MLYCPVQHQPCHDHALLLGLEQDLHHWLSMIMIEPMVSAAAIARLKPCLCILSAVNCIWCSSSNVQCLSISRGWSCIWSSKSKILFLIVIRTTCMIVKAYKMGHVQQMKS
jgi:hypothetical protein